VNYLGHVAVALATGRREPAFLLGAALPDLASMVGVRFDRAALPRAVADGVDCHLAADTAFHDHHAFRAGAAALRQDLRAAGLPTGPRRAIGHAGWELLLDGTLVGTATEGAYREALTRAGDVTASMAPADRRRWEAVLGGGAPPRLRYDEPAWVTDRLVTMLARRPRLAVPAGAAPVVTAALAAHVDAVVAVAASLLGDVATALEPAVDEP
jgi:hypothetical protein